MFDFFSGIVPKRDDRPTFPPIPGPTDKDWGDVIIEVIETAVGVKVKKRPGKGPDDLPSPPYAP